MKPSLQLRAIRATLASLMAQIEALESEVELPCDHPERERKNLATFDAPGRWQCGVCGHIGGEAARKD